MKRQIVIEIDDDYYREIMNANTLGEELLTLEEAVVNGTLLPKGHGDLKDQNELLTVLIKSAEAHCQNSREDALMGRVRQQILGCRAIIEADEGE